jgi:surface carbohydrate biosynthesis protein
LHIDEKQRDMHIMYWISLWLERFCGFKTYFCNRVTRDQLWEIIKPDIMLDTHFNHYELETLAYRSNFTKFCVLPAEGAIFNDKIITWLYFKGGKDDDEKKQLSNYLTKAFLWGEKTKEKLLRTELFNKDQLVVSGNPHYDVYMKENTSREKSMLGILTMFKGINIFDNRNYLQFYDGLRRLHGTHYGEDRNVEDLIWYYTCGFRVTLDLLDYLMKDGDFDVLLRPHQNENPDSYRYLEKKFYKKVNLEYETPFFVWLQKVYAVILCKSTTIAEAIVAGKPVISIEKLMGDRLDDHMNLPDNRIPFFMKYAYQPKTYKEAVELCKEAKEGKLPLTPVKDNEGLDELIESYFGYSRKRKLPATYIIAKETLKIYLENRDFFRRKTKKIVSIETMKNRAILGLKNCKYFLGKRGISSPNPESVWYKYGHNNCFLIAKRDRDYLESYWYKNIHNNELERSLKDLSSLQ